MDMKWIERTVITVAIGLIAFLWQQQSSKLDEALEKVSKNRMYVIEHYVRKEDYDRDIARIEKKIDKILDILSRKADKEDLKSYKGDTRWQK